MISSREFQVRGNPRLKQVGAQIEFTVEQVQEYIKCSQDPIYFIRNYVRVIHVDRGEVPFDLYEYQERFVQQMHQHRKTIAMAARQSGKSISTIAYLLWFVLFNDSKNCFIVANKEKTAKMLLDRLKFSYECLPHWLQQGVVEWNKTSIVLENGSMVQTSATSADGIRGQAVSCLVIDELAFVPGNIAESFWTSVYPTISSGKDTKVLLSSTPCGFNLFWKIWTEAEQGSNGFTPVRMHWHELPGRDEEWFKEQLKALGEVKVAQEVLCEFAGSSKTLIPNSVLSTLPKIVPQTATEHLKIFEQPQQEHSYIAIADTGRGDEGDYSVCTVIDVTQLPYSVVAVYRNNTITPYAFPEVIFNLATKYNEAYALVENNDAGHTVAELLWRDLEYFNMFSSKKDKMSGAPSDSREHGIRTTKRVKALGCSALKTIITNGHLQVNDVEIISEFGSFVAKNGSYSAETGMHDDLTMTLVLFAFLTQQPIFKTLTDIDTRAALFKSQIENLEHSLAPIGGLITGLEETTEKIGTELWTLVPTHSEESEPDNSWL